MDKKWFLIEFWFPGGTKDSYGIHYWYLNDEELLKKISESIEYYMSSVSTKKNCVITELKEGGIAEKRTDLVEKLLKVLASKK